MENRVSGAIKARQRHTRSYVHWGLLYLNQMDVIEHNATSCG
jgi:hypothetical protein